MAGPLRRVLTLLSIRFKHNQTDLKLSNYNLKNYVEELGYPFEVHENIKTEDGYLLTMFRVPHGRKTSSPQNSISQNQTPNVKNSETGKGEPQTSSPKISKPPVLLMHGLGCAGDSWLISGPNHSLALLLADKGYDVWIGNARGTSHSLKHDLLDPLSHSKKFWDFSTHEIGRYDLYAKVDYIVKTTKQKQIYFIGHSEGCSHFFVMASTKPVINRNIKVMFALAPVVYHKFKFRKFINERLGFGILRLTDIVRRLVGLRSNFWSTKFKYIFCESRISTPMTCNLYFNQVLKFDFNKTHPEHAAIMKHLFPESYSIKQLLHSLQTGLTGEFKQYHHGFLKNLWTHETKFPPRYYLQRIDVPVVLFMGEKDRSAPPEVVKKLARNLPFVVGLQEIKTFQHVDFMSADAAARDVYPKIFEIMSKLEKR